MPDENTWNLEQETGVSMEDAPENVEQTPASTEEGAAQTEEAVESTSEHTEATGNEQPAETDKFFETFNSKFNTEFQSDDDISALIKSRDELSSLKEQSSKWSDYEKSVKDYESKITELEGQLDPLAHFSSKDAYIAEQLRRQHPDKDSSVLQEVVTKDLKEIGDMDILAKQLLLDNPDLEGGLQGAKEYLDDKYGIDRDDEDYEMSTATKNRMRIDANKARKDLQGLKESVELPQVMTAEERERAIQEAKEAKVKELTPVMDRFRQFDKLSIDLGEDSKFEFDVPGEFKDSLGDMFKGAFIDGDMEFNEENLERVMEIRDAMLLKDYFPTIHEIIKKEAMAQGQKETDKLLNNEAPENRSTATDEQREAKDDSSEFNAWLNSGVV